MRHIIAAAVVAALCAFVPAAAEPPPAPSYVIRASTANPAVGTLKWDHAEGVACQVDVDAGSHAVTVSVRLVLSGGALGWVEWTTANGTAAAGAPWFFVIPYNLFEVRISVANAGGDVVTAGCLPYGGGR